MKTNKKLCTGFTLIELLIAVAIVGILAGIAYPSYSSYLYKSRRPDAMNALLGIQMAEEKYRANNPSYTTDLGNLYSGTANSLTTETSPDGYYNITLVSADSTTFSIKAAPTGKQTGDSCGTYYVNQKGPDTTTSGAADSSCWNQ